MIPEEVLEIIHLLDTNENKQLAVQWYSYIINTKCYITPNKFKELEKECEVTDFPNNPYLYQKLGNHLDAYLQYWFYTGDNSLNSPMRVVHKAKAWAETNCERDYHLMISEVRSIEYLFSQISSFDWSHLSQFMRRKIQAYVTVEMNKKYKGDYKDLLQNQLLIFQRISKKSQVNKNIPDTELQEFFHL